MQTFSGREYLAIDIANNFGLDKLDWDDRLHWFKANEPQLDALVKMAKEPALFYAGVKAWRDVGLGRPIGYMISLDATSSGLQLLAALTGDPYAARLCNVVDTGHREDAYTNVYQHMLHIVQDTAKISRDDAKDAIMTSLYGSTAVPRTVFGKGRLLDIFYGTMQTLAPAAWELNEAFLGMWDGNALDYRWVLPDNFHVRTKVMSTVGERVHFLKQPFEVFYKVNRPLPEGRSLGANCIHSIDGMIVRELTRRCDYDPQTVARLTRVLDEAQWGGNRFKTDDDKLVVALWQHFQKSGYLSARILDHIELDNVGHVDPIVIRQLVESLPARPFKLVSIHDCFRCLPHYGNDLRTQYNLQLQLIARSDLLSYLVSQIVGRQVSVTKLDPQLWRQVGSTNYALS